GTTTAGPSGIPPSPPRPRRGSPTLPWSGPPSSPRGRPPIPQPVTIALLSDTVLTVVQTGCSIHVMYERFATPTRRILVEAEAEARELGHHFIDTQHLVLGMLVPDPDTNSPVRAMLLASGLDLDEARQAVAHMEQRRMSAPIIGTIPFSPETKK